ncbi:uncharacterized protein TNCT_250481, partial [Trichonephila clavata]
MIKEIRDETRELSRNTGFSKDCIALRKAQATFKKSIIEAKRFTYKNFLEKLDLRRDGVKAHKFLSQLNNKNFLRNEPIKRGSKELTSDKDISSAFCGHYARVSNYRPNFKILKSDLKPQQNNNSADFQQLLNDDFNLEELRNGISTLVKGKSAGPDGILPEFLINLGNSAKMTLLAFINQTWKNGLKSACRKAIIVPILKPNKPAENIDSYRPTLTNIMCKLTEGIIANRLLYVLDKIGIISEGQAGFQRH